MTVGEIAAALHLEVIGANADLSREVRGGYASDLLSCAMAGAKPGDVWVTLQAHLNVVAVASLTEVAGVIITEGARPDADTVKRADQESIALLGTKEDTFSTVARLVKLGVGEPVSG